MKFLFPTFLFALFAIAVPIIIHLFNFRKFKKVYFTNVRFLKNVRQETQSKSQLKHLLVLCSRILAISFLVFAFAQPYIPSDNKKAVTGEKAISIFLDNSFSMEALGTSGSLFEEARKRAREIAGAYKPTDKFQLLTNDFEARHQRMVNKDEFLELLDEVQVSPSFKKLSQIVSRQKDILVSQEEDNKYAFIVSDFQRSFIDLGSIRNDSLVDFKLVPLKSEQNHNLYIDSVWFSSPVRILNQSEELIVRIKNSSTVTYENIPVKLFINNLQKGLGSVSIGPGETEELAMAFTINEKGNNQGVVKITDHPITYDDDFYFSFQVAQNLPLLVINEEKENPYLNSLFSRDDFFMMTNVSGKNIDLSLLTKNKLILLNGLATISSGLAQELAKFVQAGGNIFIIPAKDMDYDSYRIFLAAMGSNYYTGHDTVGMKTGRINLDHIIFKNVFEKVPENMDLPVTFSHFVISSSTRTSGEELFRLQNGNALLSRYSSGKGFIYLSAVPFHNDFGNFHKHALIVPVLYNIALYSIPHLPMFFTVGKDEIIEPGQHIQRDEIFRLTSEETDFDIIPEHKTLDGRLQLFMHNQVNTAGNYKLMTGNESTGGISYNYDRAESDLDYFSASGLAAEIENIGLFNFVVLEQGPKDMTTVLEELNLGRRLWKLCIIFALLFLLTEILLLRFFKIKSRVK